MLFALRGFIPLVISIKLFINFDRISREVSFPAKEFIRRLLDRKISDRLGSGPTGAEELKTAQFLNSYDFNRVLAKEYSPEFKPPSSFNPMDVSNFESEFTNEKPADSIIENVFRPTDLIDAKPHFDGFSFFGGKPPNDL